MERIGIYSSRRRHLSVVTTVATIVAASAVVLVVAGPRASASTVGNPATVTTVAHVVDQDRGAVLSDGSVSQAEMRSALQQMVQCVSDAGYRARLVDFTPGLGWHITVDAASEDQASRASVAVDSCSNGAVGAVMDQYWLDNRLTLSELEVFDTLLSNCLAAHGIALQTGQSPATAALERSREFTQCQIEALAQVR